MWERIIPAMMDGGGYVFASDHSIPNSVSFENMKQIAERDSKISMLEEKNEKLVLANGSLLQKIPVGQIKRSDEVKEETPKEIKWDDIFDKKGGFIH